MNSISVNGKTYRIKKSIYISKGKVIIDGQKVSGDYENDKEIYIKIEGEVNTLDIDVCESIEITGNVGTAKTSQGDIKIDGDVIADVKTSQGDIEIEGDVNGNVTNNMGDIKVGGDIYGKPKTSMGDIKGKKIYIEK